MLCKVFADMPQTPENVCGKQSMFIAIRYGTGTVNVDPESEDNYPYVKRAGDGYVVARPICIDHVPLAVAKGDQIVHMDRNVEPH